MTTPGSGDEIGRFLTVADAAELLAVDVPTVDELIRSGELPAIRVGTTGPWRVERTQLEVWIEEQYERPAPALALEPGRVRERRRALGGAVRPPAPGRLSRCGSYAEPDEQDPLQRDDADAPHLGVATQRARARAARGRGGRAPTRSSVPCTRPSSVVRCTGVRRRHRSRSTNGSPMRSASAGGRRRATARGSRSSWPRRRQHGRDRRERHDALPAAGPAGVHARRSSSRGRTRAGAHRARGAPRSSIRMLPTESSPAARAMRDEAVAKGEPAEPEALLLEGERPLLVALLLVELRLEVVEQLVPAHARTLPSAPPRARSFSTGAEIP